MKILLIYPEFPVTFWSFTHALKFINKKASQPPLGLVTIAAMLPEEWQKKLVDMNVTSLTKEDLSWADIVMISAMIVQRESARKVIHLCKESSKMIVAGGPLFTSEFDSFPEVDYFVLNEAEITLPIFLNDLEFGKMEHIYSTSEFADLVSSPVPLWELVDLNLYDSLSIQYSRGCPFSCDFCNITALLGHRPRTKNASQVIAELDRIYNLGWRRNIFFVDDNFIGNKRELKENILPELIKWRKGKSGCHFITEASINLADDSDLLTMMSQAGFASVFVGVETPNEGSLAECHKVQNTRRSLLDSVRTLQKAGLQVMGGFIVGFDADTPAIFQRQIDFIQQSGIVTAMVGMLQAPSGTQLYNRLKLEGRLIEEMSGDNADGTTNIIPRMGIENLKAGYGKLISEIYDPKNFYLRVRTFLKNYQPPKQTVHIEWEEMAAFFRSVWFIGIRGKIQKEYWKLFFWALFHYPRKFALAITLSIYGFHFSKVMND